MLRRLPAHLRKHPGSEEQGRPQEGQDHSALLPKGGGAKVCDITNTSDCRGLLTGFLQEPPYGTYYDSLVNMY